MSFMSEAKVIIGPLSRKKIRRWLNEGCRPKFEYETTRDSEAEDNGDWERNYVFWSSISVEYEESENELIIRT